MTGKVYKVIEVVGTSTESVEQAIQNAVAEADRTLKELSWFEVKEIRGRLKGGEITEYQVVTKIGFRLIE